ncbi:MAG TPA: ComEC/Rec2 family competence protein [Verrucomicrobiota bacterium]|nr:ComEC/Rec2 family competence protein [Verrucomicrobiota bacterium]
MRRPLVWLTLVYAGGLVLAELFQPPLALLFSISLGLAVAALSLAAARPWLIWPLVLFTGWTNLANRTTPLSPHDLRLTIGPSAKLATIRGTLCETPGHRTYVRNEEETVRSIAQVHVKHLQCRGGSWQPASGEVLVITPALLPGEIFAGRAVEIAGVLAPPPEPVAEGLFDYRAHLRRQGVYYLLNTSGTNDWRLLDAKRARPLADRFLAWARTTLARGLPEEDEALRLIWAMSLGWKPALTNETYEPFMRSGTMHIFAISGLHVALIAGILAGLLRMLQVSRTWCGWAVVPLIWFYTVATGWQPSAIRATVMMSIIIGGWALKRPSDLLNSLAAAAFVILLWDPRQMFGASFQLSFLVVLSIGLLVPPLDTARDRLFQTDPLLPTDLLPGWRRWLATPLRVATSSTAVSLAAWLGSLPLTAYYFHLFSPVTVLANILIVPFSSLALAASLGSVICGAWLPWVTEWFNYSGWFWMRCMVKLSELATLFPGGYCYVRGPSGLEIAAYYLLLIGSLSGIFLAARQRRWLLTGAVSLAGFCGCQWLAARPPASLTVIPVNGGMATYFRDLGKSSEWLMDCGATNSVEFIAKPFLRARGVNYLPALILTHGDLRHIGGAGLIAEMFRARQILVSPLRFRSPMYRQLIQEFERRPQWLRRISSGDRLGPWMVLHPSADDRFGQADDGALVLSGRFYSTRVLLLSDLGRVGQDALLERTPDLRADIVVTGLPSQNEALSDALLEAIQPRLIVVADSEFPAAERAGAKLIERLAHRKTPVVYTRSAGAATIEFRRSGWEIRARNGVQVRSGDLKSEPDAVRADGQRE